MSLYYCNQKKESYDLFLINNGSSDETTHLLKEWVKSGLVPVKNMYNMSEVSVSQAWNLFLSVSKDYQFRTKMDNDVVLFNTPISKSPPKKEDELLSAAALEAQTGHNPAAAAATARRQAPPAPTNPGAVRNASIVKGASASTRNKSRHDLRKYTKNHSAFLDHLEEYQGTVDAGLVSLIPVTPGESFFSMYQDAHRVTYKGSAYLFGACMLITKDCFDTLGYFDERLPRRIDIEYSQRAIRNGINISYHDHFWVSHIGARNSTEPKEEKEQKYQMALHIDDTQPAVERYSASLWDDIMPALQKASEKDKIVNLQ